MASLKQCDRCKFVAPTSQINRSITIDDDRDELKFDTCVACTALIKSILSDGGAQWTRKDK
jgi:hypothetical protein